MLSQRMTALFDLLQCTNSDIARFAGCTPSNISRVKSGARAPAPDSRSMLRIVRGVYRYADDENMLRVLCDLCGAPDPRAEALIPAVLAWLYQEKAFTLPPPVTPKSKRERERRQRRFSERLDQAMTLLEMTNGRLAAGLNVDVSLVSRYRSGMYYPNRNMQIRARLAELLLARAEKLGRREQLAALCAANAEAFGPDALAEWLYAPEEQFPEAAEALLRSMDALSTGRMPSESCFSPGPDGLPPS